MREFLCSFHLTDPKGLADGFVGGAATKHASLAFSSTTAISERSTRTAVLATYIKSCLPKENANVVVLPNDKWQGLIWAWPHLAGRPRLGARMRARTTKASDFVPALGHACCDDYHHGGGNTELRLRRTQS
jgi:hypothetical protein